MNRHIKHEGDYIFHFKLEPSKSDNVIYENKLVELLREQLENLLDIVILTKEGKEIHVDGFKLLCDTETVYDIFRGPGSKRI